MYTPFIYLFIFNNPLKMLLTIHSLQALPDSAQGIDCWTLAYTIDLCLLFSLALPELL